MAGTLGDMAIGASAFVNIDGALTECLVIHHGKPSDIYDDSFNDGTWLLIKELAEPTQRWHGYAINDYAASDVYAYLNNTFLNRMDSYIRGIVKVVKIPYRPGYGTSMTVNSGADGLESNVFLLSGHEMGGNVIATFLPKDGSELSYFSDIKSNSANAKRIARRTDGTAALYWLCSPETRGANTVHAVTNTGAISNYNCTSQFYLQPAFVLQSSALVSGDGTVLTDSMLNPPLITAHPEDITVMEGQTATFSVAAESDSGEIHYQWEVNAGEGWVEITGGGNASYTTQTAALGMSGYMYRCAAGNASEETVYSNAATLTVNRAPFIPVESIDGLPAEATAGQPLVLTGTVNPSNATRRVIDWFIKDAGSTAAAIEGNIFIAASAGQAVVTATIINGLDTADYSQDFTVTVADAPVEPIYVNLPDYTERRPFAYIRVR
ncbi:MAG: immunoglobulin domain-containing protein [Clostridiales bacterium]|jgi:hypothetical protein|nr:immunoglobulin domain-containing protein [Clostridiales bacterium]